jgi:hypothetical protein
LPETGRYAVILKNPTAAAQRDYGLAFELLESAE